MEASPEVLEAPKTVPFEITHLSTSKDGFIVTTDQSRRRKQGPRETLNLASSQKELLQKDIEKEVQRALTIARDGEQSSQERLNEQQRVAYLDAIGAKVAVRNIRQNGELLILDIKPVTYWVYQDLSQPENSPEILELAAATGTAAALITTEPDQSHRLIIQHRSAKNKSYGDIPGASAAGLLDGEFDRNPSKRGQLKPIATHSIKANITKEIFEEVAISEDDLESLTLVGVAHDNVKIHDEFLFLGTSKLSAAQIEQKAKEAPRSLKLGDEYDFGEKFVVVDATPENIARLLTEVKCPLPPTHYAAYLVLGYRLVAEANGEDAAKFWMNEIKSKCYQNYYEIDEIVRKAKKGTKYDPKKTPQEQGLPSFESELKRVGLIKMESEGQAENLREVPIIYLFDVDGVLTHPAEKKNTLPKILDQIIERLQRGEPVALNTGRSLSWMVERVVEPLNSKIEDKSILQNFLAVGEKGATWLTFDAKGQMQEFTDESITTPVDLQQEVRLLIETRYSDSMFYDETKQTIISTEMLDGFENTVYQQRQKQLVADLEAILQRRNLVNTFKVDPTTIATDVENLQVGKALGARKVLEWLKDHSIKAQMFVAFGDSKSDQEMPKELHQSGLPGTFVFVGGQEVALDKNAGYDVVCTKELYEEGTLEYLTSET